MQSSTDSNRGNPVHARRNAKSSSTVTQSIDTSKVDGSMEKDIWIPSDVAQHDQSSQEPALEESLASTSEPTSWQKWRNAFQKVLPIYLATHLAFLILTYLAPLFAIKNFSMDFFNVQILLNSWFRWDTGQYISIATFGYQQHWKFAFFPLFPLLEKGSSFLTHDPFIAGLLISNIAGLGMLVVLYRLLEKDFDAGRAYRTALYLSVFPTAFFFATAYNESLFLLLILLSFYNMRQANWWLAGLFGLLATLTRSAGLILLLPFYYEYIHQHRFNLRTMRFDCLAGALIPAGLGLYSLYCYFQVQDALAFSRAESHWNRNLHAPWQAFIDALRIIQHQKLLTFFSIHNVLDLSACLFVLCLLVLCIVGPWKFSRDHLAYSLYASGIYIWFLLFPTIGLVPMASYSRYILEVFPAFIVLAAIGKKRQPELYYLTLSLTLLSLLLLQFLTGHWVV